jgi:glycosyltransferase involved in cell wall biosynthesis
MLKRRRWNSHRFELPPQTIRPIAPPMISSAPHATAKDAPSAPRIRVLVIAESCNPEWESVPLLGWSHANALREVADVHIVTRLANRDALRRAGLVEGVDFTALNNDILADAMFRLVQRMVGPNRGWAMLTALQIPSYWLLEWLLWRRFGADLRGRRFDIVHRITPVSPVTPSLIAGRCRRAGVPFILGPINGGLPWPPGFAFLKRRDGEYIYKLRDLHRLLPGYRSSRRNAAAILVGSVGVRDDIGPRWRDKTIYLPENGIELARFPAPDRASPESYRGRPLRAVFIGRLVAYKCTDLLIEAAAPLLAAGRLTLTIIGFGPERVALEAQVAALGLAGSVSFTGKISHHDIADLLRAADVFTFPSVHEFGGAVVLEAMAMGVVPIVVAYGGPGELVSPACSIALPISDRAGLVATLRATLGDLTSDPARLAPLAAAAVVRANSLFAWPVKARQVLEVYRWVLGWRDEKPDFGTPLSDLLPGAEDPTDDLVLANLADDGGIDAATCQSAVA